VALHKGGLQKIGAPLVNEFCELACVILITRGYVIEEMVALNPHLTSSQLKKGITMVPNDPTQIKDVNFSELVLGIKALPEISSRSTGNFRR
jgi:hypothetical protein